MPPEIGSRAQSSPCRGITDLSALSISRLSFSSDLPYLPKIRACCVRTRNTAHASLASPSIQCQGVSRRYSPLISRLLVARVPTLAAVCCPQREGIGDGLLFEDPPCSAHMYDVMHVWRWEGRGWGHFSSSFLSFLQVCTFVVFVLYLCSAWDCFKRTFLSGRWAVWAGTRGPLSFSRFSFPRISLAGGLCVYLVKI